MSNMLTGQASFNVNMSNFMNEFKNNLNEIQNGSQGTKLGKIPSLNTSNIDTPVDQELTDDLKLLTRANLGVSEIDQTGNSLSADKTVKSFGNILGNYLNDVSKSELNADKAAETFATGGNIDVHSVMIAAEKANMSMQLTMQMRNKILQAYQEISRMQV